MEEPKIKIFNLDNGWLIEWKDYWEGEEDEEDKIHWRQQAFTYDEDLEPVKANKSRCDALQEMFYFIKETLGEFHQKHDTWNLRVVLEKDGEIVDE